VPPASGLIAAAVLGALAAHGPGLRVG
jgi:hypothetical protein